MAGQSLTGLDPALERALRPRPDAVTWLLFYLTILLAVPSRLVIPQLGSAGAPSMLLGLVALAMWALYQLSRTSPSEVSAAPRPVRRALFVFLAALAISFVVGMTRPVDGDEVSPAIVAILSVLSWSGTLLVANDGVADVGRLAHFVKRLSWAGGLIGLLGVVQFATGEILIDRINLPGLTPGAFEVFTRGGIVRPSGTASHPIEFGIILAMVIPFALHSAYHGRHRNLLFQWLPVLLLGISIAMTFSRSAYVSLAVAVVILLVGWSARRRRAFAIGALVMAAMLFAAVPRLFGTILSLFRNVGNDPSIESRTDSYQLALEFIAQSPLFGRALGTFQPKYRIFDNQYLLLAVSIGVVGVLAFAAVCLAGMKAALDVYRTTGSSEIKDLAVTLAASIGAGMTGLATFDAFAFPMTMGTLFLVLGIAGATHRLAGPASAARERPTGDRERGGRGRAPGQARA